MSMMQSWQQQRSQLQNIITTQTSPEEAVRHLRHALLQTEQNALSGMDDDTLRQQAGILMSSLKGALPLLEAHSTARIWVAQKSNSYAKRISPVLFCAGSALLLLLIWCVWKSFWGAAVLSGAAFLLGLVALMQERRHQTAIVPEDELKVTVCVDPERLFNAVDAQIRAIDRFLEDFIYLNDQTRGVAEAADPQLLSRAAGLLEALYDCDETDRQPAEEAAFNLLAQLGMQPVSYSSDTGKLFNTLPSKSVTRTLSPAIVSTEDQRLLRRGTAAVQMEKVC